MPVYFVAYPERDEAIARAYWSTAYSMAEIAAHLGISSRTVSRAVQRMEEKRADVRVGAIARKREGDC
ncbi:MAG TPA: winged helix-turn-helix domain-containing protein [Telluria sp.]